MSGERGNVPAVVGTAAPVTMSTLHSSLAVPAMIANAGDRASRRFLDFFAASINNDNTRMAYYRAVCNFLAWREQHGIGELPDIEPFHVAAYLKVLETTAAKPTVKQNLAAIRMLFDWLIVGQVLAINPAHEVRGPKHLVSRGKTPVLTEGEARRLLASIKVTKKVRLADGSEEERPSVVGLRDRALVAVMTYSFARISAVIGMKVEDYFPNGKRWWVRLYEKGGKVHEMPAHHKLEQYLDEYLVAAGIRDQEKTSSIERLSSSADLMSWSSQELHGLPVLRFGSSQGSGRSMSHPVNHQRRNPGGGDRGFGKGTIGWGDTGQIVLPNQRPSLGCGSKSTHRNEKMRAAVECRNGRNESGVAVTRWGSRRCTGSCRWTMIRRRQEPVVSARRRKRSGVQHGSPIPLI